MNTFSFTSLSEQSQRELFRFVADCTYDWESWLDLESKLVWVNPAVERLTSFTMAECLAMQTYPLEIVAPADRPAMQAILENAAQGGSGNDREFRIVKKDGTLHWFAVSWQPLVVADGNCIGFRMSMRDICDRKQLEEEREKQNLRLEELAQARATQIVKLRSRQMRNEKLAALGVMAAKVAHEINNPMAGIKNAIRLIQEENELPDDASRMFHLVDNEIERIIRILRQLYQLYRPNLSAPTPFDLVKCIDDVLVMIESQFDKAMPTMKRVRWPQNLQVVCFEHELKQILYNLILNAVQASKANDSIEIELEDIEEERLRIRICDHGHGIPSDMLPHLFEPFYTSKHGREGSGTGLGLAISQSLATAMGGTIDAQATIGGGATFTVEIPVVMTTPTHVQQRTV
ncbi:two-component system sensor histidine kinase NtrB [Pirellulaceae bacterium SH501]